MEVEFIIYDPCVKYFNLEMVSFIEVLNWTSNGHIVQVNEKQKLWDVTGLYLFWAKFSRPKEIRLRKKIESSLGTQTTLGAFLELLEFFLICFCFYFYFLMRIGIWGKGKYYKQILPFFVSCWEVIMVSGWGQGNVKHFMKFLMTM